MITMKEYKYVLTRKYPFIKKRPLTRLELIERRYWELVNIMPIVITIGVTAKTIGWIKSKLKL